MTQGVFDFGDPPIAKAAQIFAASATAPQEAAKPPLPSLSPQEALTQIRELVSEVYQVRNGWDEKKENSLFSENLQSIISGHGLFKTPNKICFNTIVRVMSHAPAEFLPDRLWNTAFVKPKWDKALELAKNQALALKSQPSSLPKTI